MISGNAVNIVPHTLLYHNSCIFSALFSVVERISEHKLSLTILNVSGLQRHDYCRRLFCTVMLGRNRKCRTPSVEGKNTASWNFTVSVLSA